MCPSHCVSFCRCRVPGARECNDESIATHTCRHSLSRTLTLILPSLITHTHEHDSGSGQPSRAPAPVAARPSGHGHGPRFGHHHQQQRCAWHSAQRTGSKGPIPTPSPHESHGSPEAPESHMPHATCPLWGPLSGSLSAATAHSFVRRTPLTPWSPTQLAAPTRDAALTLTAHGLARLPAARPTAAGTRAQNSHKLISVSFTSTLSLRSKSVQWPCVQLRSALISSSPAAARRAAAAAGRPRPSSARPPTRARGPVSGAGGLITVCRRGCGGHRCASV